MGIAIGKEKNSDNQSHGYQAKESTHHSPESEFLIIWSTNMAPEDIDRMVAVMTDLLKVGSAFYPPLAVAAPILTSFIQNEASKLHVGLANGTIVPDGRGGFAPVTNSRFDPKTGEFL
jgi:hypothetical protein